MRVVGYPVWELDCDDERVDHPGLQIPARVERHGAAREGPTVWVVRLVNGYAMPETARPRDRLTRLSLEPRSRRKPV